MSESCKKDCGFMFGIFIGAIAAAIVAIVIYRQKDTLVFKKYKQKLQSYIKTFLNLPAKRTLRVKPIKKTSKPKFFKKA